MDELLEYVLELDGLLTKEFCEKYNHEVPTWKGNVEVAAYEFITLDAIKYKMIIDKAKTIYRNHDKSI